MNPLFIYELLKQKVQWNTYLTPIKKINDYFQTFLSLEQKVVVIDGSILKDTNDIKDCDQKTKPDFSGIPQSKDIQTILVQVTNICKIRLPKEDQILLALKISEFKDQINKLVKEESEILNLKGDQESYISVAVPLGGNKIPEDKKEILNLLFTILEKEYEKADHKDGKLQKQIQNELGLIESEKNNFVQLIDLTNLKNDPALCDASSEDFHNIVILTTIKKFRMVDQGKSFCVDVDLKTYYQQMKQLSVINNSLSPEKVYSIHRIQSDDQDSKNGSGMMDSGKKIVLESYVASLLSTLYADSTQWKVQWLRIRENLIIIKIVNLQTNHLIFNEISIEEAESSSEVCPKYEIEPVVREFIWVNKYCKKSNETKMSVLITGVEETKIKGLNVTASQLEESKSPKDYEAYRDLFTRKTKSVYYYNNPYYSYGGLYRYNYNRGIYGFPFMNNSLQNSVVYAPPLVTSILPTAPIVNQVLPPYTFNLPMISNNTYSYVAPYYRILRSDLQVQLAQEDVAQEDVPFEKEDEVKPSTNFPKQVSSMKELAGLLIDQQPSALIMEKISNQMYRIQFEKECLAETHFYAFVDKLWYDFPTKERKLC
jgi:hypothetical protein